MKPIKNKAPFKNKLPFQYQDGKEKLYSIQKRLWFKEFKIKLVHPDNEGITCSFVCEVEKLPGASFRRERPNSFGVEYIVDGSLLAYQAREFAELEAGDLFLLHPDKKGEWIAGPNGCHKKSLTFHGPLLKQFLKLRGLYSQNFLSGIDGIQFNEFYSQFLEDSYISSQELTKQNGRLSFAFLQFLENPYPQKRIPQSLQKLIVFLTEHLSEDFYLEDMASFCKCSKSKILRLTTKYLGKTPCALLMDLRMTRARELLLNPKSFSLKEIADMVGYRDACNFSTVFKKYYGKSPTQYLSKSSEFT